MTGKRLGAAAAAGLGVVVAVAAAAALGVFTHGHAASAIGARADGVKVHGQWTIVVRSKSGKVVSRHSFHNDFVPGTGGAAFSSILSGGSVAGDWLVDISGSGCSSPAVAQVNTCELFEPDAIASFDATFDTRNLTVTVPTSGSDVSKIVLVGTVPAVSTGTISVVKSSLQVCPTSAPAGADCSQGHGIPNVGYKEITSRDLSVPPSSPISVLSGQSISVTVKISFS